MTKLGRVYLFGIGYTLETIDPRAPYRSYPHADQSYEAVDYNYLGLDIFQKHGFIQIYIDLFFTLSPNPVSFAGHLTFSAT